MINGTSLAAERGAMCERLLAGVNPQAQLLRHCNIALLGHAKAGGTHLAVYDAQVLQGLGLSETQLTELSNVLLLQRGFLDLDSVYLATLHHIGDVEPIQNVTPKQRHEAVLALGASFQMLVRSALELGLDLPTLLASFYDELAQAPSAEESSSEESSSEESPDVP